LFKYKEYMEITKKIIDSNVTSQKSQIDFKVVPQCIAILVFR
jgi:hypothetical protein